MTDAHVMIVHILHHGQPLCAFTTKVPKDWPEGHKWMGLTDYRVHKGLHVNCKKCIATEQEMTDSVKGN